MVVSLCGELEDILKEYKPDEMSVSEFLYREITCEVLVKRKPGRKGILDLAALEVGEFINVEIEKEEGYDYFSRMASIFRSRTRYSLKTGRKFDTSHIPGGFKFTRME
ncbi:MAG: hypothetical protein DRN30_00735 [Thermoplasmata archaeon]|nr:MAG: hypothetical protein DRN30_00735 [Thermoplasmata archaeon]